MTKRKKNKARKNLTQPNNWATKYTQNATGGATGGNIGTNTQSKTYTQTSYQAVKCHTGNTTIYTAPNGAKLQIGGWNNGAKFDWNTHVIDLTGLEHKYWDIPIAYDEASKGFLPFLMQAYAGWLSLPFPDYGTPTGLKTLEQWEGITSVIEGILAQGRDVLVACHGGHGRSGLFCAIVGYLLNAKDDPTWASPVEKIRKIHCEEAVETYAQEKFVYDILGLRIKPRHYYDDDMYWYGRTGTYAATTDQGRDFTYTVGTTFKVCPLCGTQSLYVDEYGMCMTCRNAFEATGAVPEREDLTLEDIKDKGKVTHSCDDDRCVGIWKASKCGHTVHNQLIYEGYCEACYKKYEDEVQYAEEKLNETKDGEACALCGKVTPSSNNYGVCFDCSSKLVQNNLITDVHCSITDPYKFISHSHCENEHACVGIIRADVCQHVVHNREVEKGLCPSCFEVKFGKELNEYAL